MKGCITDHDMQSFTRPVMSGAIQTVAAKEQAKPAAASSGNDGPGSGLIPWPKVDFAKFGPIERKELSRIKKISGANLLCNAILIPAVTNHDDVDITDLEAFRVSTNKENEKSGIKITMLAFLIKACVVALKKYPEFNSLLDAESDGAALIYRQYYTSVLPPTGCVRGRPQAVAAGRSDCLVVGAQQGMVERTDWTCPRAV